jgi:UDP-N-acetylglucosamine 2-epimerase
VKVLTVIGTRPQFIKSVLVSREMAACGIEEVVVHTGQHYDHRLSRAFFDELSLASPKHRMPPNHSNVVTHIAAVMQWLERIIAIEEPDIVLVYGDCNSTLAAALSAAKTGVPLAHVEAGPRQHDMSIPEEQNRVITDHLSTWNFCPTRGCLRNLENEGTHGTFTGDVMLDNFMHFRGKTSNSCAPLPDILLTFHRPVNTDDPARLKLLCYTIMKIAETHSIMFPVHPRTRRAIQEAGLWKGIEACAGVCEPLSYLEMLRVLIGGVKMVMTDSGGLQKEAYFAGVPCITLDDSSPWPETVESGGNAVAGADMKKAVMMAGTPFYRENGNDPGLFGDGKAHKKIVRELLTGGKQK